MIPEIEIPELYKFLFEPMRYKVAFGGRSSLKTWSYCRGLLLLSTLYDINYTGKEIGEVCDLFKSSYSIDPKLIRISMKRPHKIMCTRELMTSISESVHALFVSQIRMLNLVELFDITDHKIRCRNGSEIHFDGLSKGGHEHNIKGVEGTTICWVEEAELISEASWKYLRPTIREPDSEIWVSFNTRYADDPTYKQFVENPPQNSIVKFINITDVPQKYIPKVLKDEYESDKKLKTKAYVDNVWHGLPTGAGRKIWPDFEPQEWNKGHIRTWEMKDIVKVANFFRVCDPAQHYYPAIIWIALIPVNSKCEQFYKWIYDEYPTFNDFNDYFCNVRRTIPYTGTLSDLSRQIYVKDGTSEYGVQIHDSFIDTRFIKGSGASNYYTGHTTGLIEQWAKPENGSIVWNCPAEKMIDSAKEQIQNDLQYNKLAPTSELNEARLFVAPWCKNVIDALSNHRLVDDKEKEDEKRKDFSDCLKIGYAGLSSWNYKNPTKREENYYIDYGSNNIEGGWMG